MAAVRLRLNSNFTVLLPGQIARRKSSIARCLMIALLSAIMLACEKQKLPDANGNRQQWVAAYFQTPLKGGNGFDGFWKADNKQFAARASQLSKIGLPDAMGPVRENQTAYFLRIEGLNCDEILFDSAGGFMISAGALKKLEATRDRIVYSVVFNRQLPGRQHRSQGAVLTRYLKAQRVELEFPAQKLTFYPETTPVTVLAEQFGRPDTEVR